MIKLRTVTLALTLAGFTGSALAEPGDRRNFVTCPIVRDTKTVPCWLAEYDGELYYLGVQIDFGGAFWPPFQGHKVLVEGQVSKEPRICGGLVLKPATVSSLPERDDNCHTILPAEDRYTIPFETRGPGPNNRSSQRPPPAPAPAAAPPAATSPEPKTFTVLYDFNNRIWNIRTERPLQEARAYAVAIHARTIDVTGFRGASLLSDGQTLTEDAHVGEMRAKQIGEILQGVGVDGAQVKIGWNETPQKADGVDDPSRRKAVITVSP